MTVDNHRRAKLVLGKVRLGKRFVTVRISNLQLLPTNVIIQPTRKHVTDAIASNQLENVSLVQCFQPIRKSEKIGEN